MLRRNFIVDASLISEMAAERFLAGVGQLLLFNLQKSADPVFIGQIIAVSLNY